jgi:hypothetical protein
MFRSSRIFSLLSVLILFTLLFVAAPPSARAQSTTAFTGEYFNNISLSGTPVFLRDDPAINFDWGNGSPDPSIPADNFSVRWQRWYNINPAGNYTFTMTSDDGSRLWVDGALVIDMWWDHAPLARAATLSLTAGYHLIRMEYYEHGGGALAQLSITSTASYPDWKGEYFDNQTLSGSPVLTLNNTEINFNWGSGSPDSSIPADHFSVRWTRTVHFTEGTYRFTAAADDGIRVWVSSELLIDQWHDQSPTTYTRDIRLPTADLGVTVEYYENTGDALAQLNWIQVPTVESWFGQYYSNPSLSGTEVFNRYDFNVSFDWGSGSPGVGIPADNFSAKWSSRRYAASTGFYTVYATADDGVRVWVDNNIVIDQWHDQAPTTYAATVYLGAGGHDWHVEYYEHFGGAQINVQIMAGVTPPPPPTGGDIIVDDGGTGWLAGGNSSSWRNASGYSGHSFWTFNNAFIQPLYNWARWYPSLPQARNYQVFAYIPAGVGSTRNARYWIAHGGTFTLAPTAQAFYPNQWVSLGTYYFNALGSEYVSLSDVTYECYLCYTIVWDAIKFSPR